MASDQDELRDRIAEIIERSLTVWMNDLSTGGAEADYAAQAIIEELELTTETHAATHSKRAMTRIISAWEWDNQ